MKNFTKLLLTALVAVFSVNMFAEKFVLDLTNPTNPESWTWTEKNYWAETYNETDYTYWESQVFAFAHLTEGKSYGGTYYDGFTVSKNASNANMTSVEGGWTENQWGCMAEGGIVSVEDGKPVVSADKPYIIGYYSSWNMVGESLDIIFNTGETYNAVGVYVTNHPWAYYDVTIGEGSASKLDQEGDYFKIIATGMLNGSKTNTAEFMLAEVKDGELNAVKDWEWFDLSALGEVDEIYFTIDGSDKTGGYLNTASYFCMDRLIVEGEIPTAVEEKKAEKSAEGAAYRIGSTIYGIAEGAQVYIYNLAGQLIINQTVNGGSITLPNAAPYYITKIVTEGGVQTVR